MFNYQESYEDFMNNLHDSHSYQMEEHKKKVLSRFTNISPDFEVREKFVKLLIDAESEGCSYAEEFMAFFELDDMDKFAVLEDLDGFIEEYTQQKDYGLFYEL